MNAEDDGWSQADDEAVEWLTKLRGTDGDSNQEQFESWYAADPRHADAYDRVLASWSRLGHAGAILSQDGRAVTLPERANRRWPRLAGAAAAAAAMVLVIVTDRNGRSGSPQLFSAAYASVIGEIKSVKLPDGSRVTLDTDTALRTTYSDRERRVRVIHGRARFKVVADSRPFVVDAGSRSVIATGTEFDVELAGSKLAVSLLDGKVDIGRTKLDKPQALEPGQKLVFDVATPDGLLGRIDGNDAKWPSGQVACCRSKTPR